MSGTLAQPLACPVPGQQRLTEATQDPGLQHCLTPVPGHPPDKDPEQGRLGAGGKQLPHRVGDLPGREPSGWRAGQAAER